MSFAQSARIFLEYCLDIGVLLLGMAFVLTIVRIWKGPTLPDRVVGLDVMTNIAIGFITVIAIDTGFTLYVDLAIGLALVGFLATVAFARFVLARGRMSEDRRAQEAASATGTPGARPWIAGRVR